MARCRDAAAASRRRGGSLVYRFGDFTLDYGIRQLFQGTTEVHLSPKAYELLTVLLTNRSRAVSKEELQQHLWPSTFVEETNLASLVAEIRRALGDAAANPALVRTVYGFGYHFIGDVAVDPVAAHLGTSRIKQCLVLDAREMVLLEGANVIGRDSDATIQVDARGVSRHHARIVVSHGDAMLEDLASKNGTHLNGRRISESTRLADGDEITLGTAKLQYRVAPLSTPTETVAIDDV